MALIRPQYWYPATLDPSHDPSFIINDPAVILDYPAAVLICAWSLGIQASTVVPIARALISSIRDGTKSNRASSPLIVTALLAVIFIVTGFLYCVGACLHLQALSKRSEAGKGVDLFRSTGVRSLRQQILVVNQMVAVGMQLMIIFADALLIYRCWIVFNGKKWICALPCVPFLISLALSLYGIVTVARSPRSPTPLPKSATLAAAPFIATISSVSVNVIATTCICVEIIRSRRKLRKLVGSSIDSAPSDTYFAVAILIESALPSAIVGLYVPFATFFTKGGVFASRVGWAAFTALAPQVILVRVLKRRDVLSILQKHEKQTSASSMQFSRSPTSSTYDID